MRCLKCGVELDRKSIGIISHYLIKPDEIIIVKKEALCPICGYVLKHKHFAKGINL